MHELTPEHIRPIHDYGRGDLTPARAGRMLAEDADAHKPYVREEGDPYFREFTQLEARHAIADRHVLMFALAEALDTIAKLSPRKVDVADVSDLPDGTLVQEWNGELSVKATKDGRAVFQSPGDHHFYAPGMLCTPLKVIPLPELEADEDEGQDG